MRRGNMAQPFGDQVSIQTQQLLLDCLNFSLSLCAMETPLYCIDMLVLARKIHRGDSHGQFEGIIAAYISQ